MKITEIRLKNYIGIYNGLGLHEIKIDFSKSKNKITVIRGKNGSGKSTIYKALHILNDPNDMFIPGLQAEKSLVICDGPEVYKIEFIHPVDSKGERSTTKGYIAKQKNGIMVELNPNGNIGSFKDILYTEFNLDGNFVTLSQLSSENRGLADKTPAERKKFVTNIISSLAVYNDIYKTLTKRSSVFKSMINTLLSKINNLNDEESLKMSIASIENRINGLETKKNSIIELIAKNKYAVSTLDPDGKIQNSYDSIYSSLDETNRQISILSGQLESLKSRTNIDGDINKYQKEISKAINSLEVSIQVEENNISNLLNKKENDYNSLQQKINKLNSLQSEKNLDQIKSELKIRKDSINSYLRIFAEMEIDPENNITKDEYILAMSSLKEIQSIISTFKSDKNYNDIKTAIDYIRSGEYPTFDISQIEEMETRIDENEKALSGYLFLKKSLSALELRPVKCKIDECSFIKEAVEAQKQNPIENIERLEYQITEEKKDLTILKELFQNTQEIIKIINDIKIIQRNIKNYSPIFSKIPKAEIFTDENRVYEKILSNNSFNEIDFLYSYIDRANVFELFNVEMEAYKQLKNELKVYASKDELIDELSKEISMLNSELDSIVTKIEETRAGIFENKKKLSELKELILDIELFKDLTEKQNSYVSKKNELLKEFEVIKSSITEIKQCNLDIVNKNNELTLLMNELKPLIEDRDRLKHNLSLLYEYQKDLAEYNAKYEKIEAIKYYSSPNTGIQTVFMELYMNKTLSLANELLQLLFDGEYVLQPFIINDKEFRIPCVGSGLRNDDISSMSTAQICMISMILSFTMLYQSSTKYNILKLDEIDGGLDTDNRLRFVELLDKQITMLSAEQCFLISHNNEINFNNVDIIQLKQSGDELIAGNIIYKY